MAIPFSYFASEVTLTLNCKVHKGPACKFAKFKIISTHEPHKMNDHIKISKFKNSLTVFLDSKKPIMLKLPHPYYSEMIPPKSV